jgi:hypothetical protein
MASARKAPEDKLNDRITVLVTSGFKKDFLDYLEAIGAKGTKGASIHIRNNWEAEIALWMASKIPSATAIEKRHDLK